jgi:hypothetical protein
LNKHCQTFETNLFNKALFFSEKSISRADLCVKVILTTVVSQFALSNFKNPLEPYFFFPAAVGKSCSISVAA